MRLDRARSERGLCGSRGAYLCGCCGLFLLEFFRNPTNMKDGTGRDIITPYNGLYGPTATVELTCARFLKPDDIHTPSAFSSCIELNPTNAKLLLSCGYVGALHVPRIHRQIIQVQFAQSRFCIPNSHCRGCKQHDALPASSKVSKKDRDPVCSLIVQPSPFFVEGVAPFFFGRGSQ